MMTNKEYADEVRKLRSEKHLAETEIRDKLKDYPGLMSRMLSNQTEVFALKCEMLLDEVWDEE